METQHAEFGFEHPMPGVTPEGAAVEVVQPRQEGVVHATNVLNMIRAQGGEGAVPSAVEGANEPGVGRKDTKVVDLAGIIDATESTQPAIIKALQGADDSNPSILADAFHDAIDGGVNIAALEHVAENIEVAEASPEATANYQGNWMQLQQERMQSDDFRQKLDIWMKEDEMSAPAPFFGKYTNASPSEIAKRRNEFGDNAANVYSKVGIGPASNYDKLPTNLGKSLGYGEAGVVYSDAVNDGNELTGAQKDLLAAHEAHHGLVQPAYKFRDELLKGFDQTKLPPTSSQGERKNSKDYITAGYELIARMAQLKNYFGMKEGETFTSEHLAYARGHYLTDTQLDNGMTEFFSMVTDETQDAFVHNMNTMPV